MEFLETKRHLQKPDEHYTCELLRRGPGWVVLGFRNPKPACVAGVHLEAGCTTEAWYQESEDWVLWKMCGPAGELKGHLFHICRDVEVTACEVTYLDLILDVWVTPEGGLHVLDEEELEAASTAGYVRDEDCRRARSGVEGVRKTWRRRTDGLAGLPAGRGG